jgi:bzd-type benzoyl-CoA reductase N subunit
MLDRFREAYANRYRELNIRKEKGQKIVGWMCLYVPEEILAAAGILPVRIIGGAERTPQADAYLYTNACSFVRSCLEEALDKKYPFLDGFVVANTCDHIRRLYDVWQQYLKLPLTHIISLPHKVDDSTLEFYTEQLRHFKEKVEDFCGQTISDKALNEAIEVYNQTRQLLHQLYRLRAPDDPPITGAQTLEILRAAMIMPKEEFNNLLADFLKGVSSQKPYTDHQVRLMVLGSELDDPEYLRIIEESGAMIVADDLCLGSRYFWTLVDPESDPIRALARRYLFNAPCPRIRPDTIRKKHLKEMVDNFRVSGAIYETIKFCDIYGVYYPMAKTYLAELGLPLLGLEREYSLASIGQMKTRVQAFLESIEG